MSYRNYKRGRSRTKTFAQEVKSRKKPAWFREQKKALEKDSADMVLQITQLDRFKKDFFDTKIQNQYEALFQSITTHQRLQPRGIKELFFTTEAHIKWQEEVTRRTNEWEKYTRSIDTDEIEKAFYRVREAFNPSRFDNTLEVIKHKQYTRFWDVVDEDIETKKSKLKKIKSNLELLLPKHKKVMAQEEKRQRDKAFLARDKKTSRKLATEIKKKLKKPKHCPYCLLLIDSNPHADHIYPLSKGGLETVSNMIYVCEKCNLLKGDLTLRKFCMKNELDYSRVAQALEKEGKDV